MTGFSQIEMEPLGSQKASILLALDNTSFYSAGKTISLMHGSFWPVINPWANPGTALNEFFSLFSFYKFSIHVLTVLYMYYPSFNKP